MNKQDESPFIKLPRGFYSRDTKNVAREILGKILVPKTQEEAPK